jgi:hypothetical protein
MRKAAAEILAMSAEAMADAVKRGAWTEVMRDETKA